MPNLKKTIKNQGPSGKSKLPLIDLAGSFKRAYKQFLRDADDKEQIDEAVSALAKDPNNVPQKLKKTKYKECPALNKKYGDIYIIHPSDHLRLIYTFDANTIYLIFVGTRENYYKKVRALAP